MVCPQGCSPNTWVDEGSLDDTAMSRGVAPSFWVEDLPPLRNSAFRLRAPSALRQAAEEAVDCSHVFVDYAAYFSKDVSQNEAVNAGISREAASAFYTPYHDDRNVVVGLVGTPSTKTCYQGVDACACYRAASLLRSCG